MDNDLFLFCIFSFRSNLFGLSIWPNNGSNMNFRINDNQNSRKFYYILLGIFLREVVFALVFPLRNKFFLV